MVAPLVTQTQVSFNSKFDLVKANVSNIYMSGNKSLRRQIHIPITLKGETRSATTQAMLDSGASTSFLNWRFVTQNKVTTQELEKPIPIRNADDSENAMGAITHTAQLKLIIETHEEFITFAITDIGSDDVIIGIDWLRYHNPDVNWKKREINFTRCPTNCDSKKG